MVQVHLDPPICSGDVAQLGEHLPCTQGVRSSILLVSTIKRKSKDEFRLKHASNGFCVSGSVFLPEFIRIANRQYVI